MTIKKYYEDCRYLKEEGFFLDGCTWVKALGFNNYFEVLFLPDKDCFLGRLFGEDYGIQVVQAVTAKDCLRLLREIRNLEDIPFESSFLDGFNIDDEFY